MDDIQGTTNNPDLSSSMKARVRAISSGGQAMAIANKLQTDQTSRNNLEAVVDRKFNGDLPWSQKQLNDQGEKWRHNFSTGFMAGIVNKVVPVPVGMIDQAKFLTSSEICSDTEDSERKTEFLRYEVTRAIRQWDGWKNFQYGLWTEVVLHGSAIVACLDPYCPWPELYRTDRAFVPVGTGQNTDSTPLVVLMKDYLVHEFVDFIKDRDIADEAGWDTKAAIDSVERALPANKVSGGTGGTESSQARSYEDAIREGNPGASYSGAKVIQVFHVLAVEPDTKNVTHYIMDRNGKNEVLFQKDDRFDSMRDVISLITLEPGNGTFYGSRGMGRMLLNMHIACESNRNLLFDQLRLAGMTILKTDSTKSPTMQMKMRHPFLIVSAEGQIEQQPIAPNVQSFIDADGELLRWAEQYAGSYISDLHGKDNSEAATTATEESIRANREQQSRVAFLARAWGMHSEIVEIMQDRLLDPETTEEVAKDLQKRAKEFPISREEINEFRDSTASEVVQDQSAQSAQALLQAYQLFNNDPAFDQFKLRDMVASAIVSPKFARDILLPEQGVSANEIEAYQKAAGENEDFLDGTSLPVSPRDRHEAHLKVHLDDLQKGLPGLIKTADPKVMDAYNIALRHAEGHVGEWEKGGADKQALKPYADAIKKMEAVLTQLAQQVQKQQQEAQQAPGALPGDPMAAGAPPGAPQQAPVPVPEEHLLKITSSITYKDAPDDIKRQIEAAAGFVPSKAGAVGNSTLPQANVAMVHKAIADAHNPNVPDPAQQPLPEPPPPGSVPVAVGQK